MLKKNDVTLYVFLWRGQPVHLSLSDDGRPPCPRLYDEVVEIPVVAQGQPPPEQRTRRVPVVADWLADIVEDD